MIRFLQNGIVADDVKGIQTATYSMCGNEVWVSKKNGSLDFNFSDEIQKTFKIINKTDITMDLWYYDEFCINPDSPYYTTAKIVYLKKEIALSKQVIKRLEKKINKPIDTIVKRRKRIIAYTKEIEKLSKKQLCK